MSREYVLQSFKAPIQTRIDYAGELNEQQHAAVTAAPGPALVIAGAGSGKTRTLTYRVAWLLEHGTAPDRILLLTFTNKAAREMMRRVAALLPEDLSGLWGGTFHSVGNRILRRHAAVLGYKSDFTIVDREDTEQLVQAAVDSLKIDVKETRFPKPDMLADLFSMAINTHRTVKEVVETNYRAFAELSGKIEQVGQAFQERKRQNNVMDFDDLLVLWLRLLEQDQSVRELYQRRFQFLLVDEYQDTNRLQSDLIDLLAARHRNVMVVGDDSQSIYSWRGANFKNIIEFPKRYSDAKVYKIETNYRSTPEILQLANAAIAANTNQFPKELKSACPAGEKPALIVTETAGQQAEFVAQRALELRDERVNLNEMAVLYRSHFHALELQLEFTRRNIPFTITSGIRFFEQAHIKDVAAFIKLVANPADEISFKRIVKLMPGIGNKAADKLWNCFAVNFLDHEKGPAPVARTLQACANSVPKKAVVPWAQFTATFAQMEPPEIRQNPARLITHLIEAVYEDYAKENFTNYTQRLDELDQLGNFARGFEDTNEFLSQLALLTNMEAEEEKPKPESDETIKLTTIHQAKGLEFDAVFVVMLCEGMFPSARSLEMVEALEEERRLFYVAVTRARKHLHLSYPITRNLGNSNGLQFPSRFLKELPDEVFEEWNLRAPGAHEPF